MFLLFGQPSGEANTRGTLITKIEDNALGGEHVCRWWVWTGKTSDEVWPLKKEMKNSVQVYSRIRFCILNLSIETPYYQEGLGSRVFDLKLVLKRTYTKFCEPWKPLQIAAFE